MDKVNNLFFLGWCTRNLYILWFTLFPLCDVEQLTLKSEIRMTKGWFQLSEWHSSLKWECPGLSEQHSGLQSEWPEGTIILALPVWTFGTTLARKSEIGMTKDDFSFQNGIPGWNQKDEGMILAFRAEFKSEIRMARRCTHPRCHH